MINICGTTTKKEAEQYSHKQEHHGFVTKYLSIGTIYFINMSVVARVKANSKCTSVIIWDSPNLKSRTLKKYKKKSELSASSTGKM